MSYSSIDGFFDLILKKINNFVWWVLENWPWFTNCHLLTNRINQMKIWIDNWMYVDRSSSNYVVDTQLLLSKTFVRTKCCSLHWSIYESLKSWCYIWNSFRVSASTVKNQKIVFKLIINQIVERIELLVIVRLYCESENNIYLRGTNACVCRFACVDLCVWKI